MRKKKTSSTFDFLYRKKVLFLWAMNRWAGTTLFFGRCRYSRPEWQAKFYIATGHRQKRKGKMKAINHDQSIEPPAMTPGDIYFILFRHKWKIILLSLAGVVAAAAYWWYYPPPFESEAKLFVRYVLDSRAVNTDPKNAQMTSPDAMGQSIINSEIEILTSFDLAEQAAKNIGPEKILAKYGGGNDPTKAAEVVRKNLVVE